MVLGRSDPMSSRLVDAVTACDTPPPSRLRSQGARAPNTSNFLIGWHCWKWYVPRSHITSVQTAQVITDCVAATCVHETCLRTRNSSETWQAGTKKPRRKKSNYFNVVSGFLPHIAVIGQLTGTLLAALFGAYSVSHMLGPMAGTDTVVKV